MSIAARMRVTLARSPWLYWAIVAALAGTAGWFLMRAADGVEAARESWGTPRQVYVAARAVEPGTVLGDSVEPRRLPAPMVPTDAVAELTPEAVARQRIAAGEVIVIHDIAPHDAPQSLIPPEWLAVAIAEPVASGAKVGDEVTVTASGVVVAPRGVIVGLAGEALLVAVPADEAPQVAHAASTGDVAVLLRP